MRTLFIITAALFLTSCAMKQRILNASAVSMSQYNNKGYTLVEAGDVTGEYCRQATAEMKTVGLLDEAIKDAQRKSKADFITNATFYAKGNCVLVEGQAMKIAKKKGSKKKM